MSNFLVMCKVSAPALIAYQQDRWTIVFNWQCKMSQPIINHLREHPDLGAHKKIGYSF
jgi:hypothetical protein